jgi:hypothetical protein
VQSAGDWLLAGITSFGAGCGRPFSLGAYTRVAAVSSWVLGAATPITPPPPVTPGTPPVAAPPVPTPPAAPADTSAPIVRALASSARRGSRAALRYRAHDDRASLIVLSVVYDRRGRRVGAAMSRFFAPQAGRSYALSWRVPRTIRTGRGRFCLAAIDRAANASRISCASLLVR